MNSVNKAFAVIGLALAACATLSQAQAPAPAPAPAAGGVVRFHEYPGNILNLVTWIMVEKGFCEREGIKCQGVTLASGPLAQQAAAAGSLDIIFTSADVMMQAVGKGNDLVIIGPQITNNLYVLVTRADLGLPNKAAGYPANVRDLKGMKIGVSARGSSTEMQMKALFTGAGMPADSATFIAVGAPSTAYSALAAKQIDAALTWDPVPSICNATKACDTAVDMRKGQGPPDLLAMNGTFVVWYARREWVDKNGPLVDAFVRSTGAATAWVKDPKNFAEALEIAKKRVTLGDVPNKDQVLNEVVKVIIDLYGLGFKRSSIEAFHTFMLNNKVLDKPLNVDSLIYSKLPK